jgi:histidine triad (HIT) family protein
MSTEAPSIFERIVAREIPADIVFESDNIIAFRDIAPKAPVHILVVPKDGRYANVTELAAGDPALLAEVVAAAQGVADEFSGGQYRLIFNTGENVGQTVFHVHAHVLADNSLGGGLTEGSLGF